MSWKSCFSDLWPQWELMGKWWTGLQEGSVWFHIKEAVGGDAFVGVRSGAVMKNAASASVQPSRLKTEWERVTPGDAPLLLCDVTQPMGRPPLSCCSHRTLIPNQLSTRLNRV